MALFLPVTAGQLNLGGAGFQALGAYLAAYLASSYGVPPLYTLPLSAVIGGIVGLALSFPVARTRGVYMVLATIAFTEVVSGAILTTPELGGASGIPVSSFVGSCRSSCRSRWASSCCASISWDRVSALAMRSVHDDETVVRPDGRVGARRAGLLLHRWAVRSPDCRGGFMRTSSASCPRKGSTTRCRSTFCCSCCWAACRLPGVRWSAPSCSCCCRR